MTALTPHVTDNTIDASLDALSRLLMDAAMRTAEARDLNRNGNRNGAIGAILDLDTTLADAAALFRVVIALHRRRP